MGLEIDTDKTQLRQLENVLDGAVKKLPQQVSMAINKTRTRAISFVAKAVVKDLAVTQKAVKDVMDSTSKSTPKTLQARVRLFSTDRIPLKEFKAKQNRKGVSYKAKVGGKQRTKNIRSAFIVDSLGGHVFARNGPKKRVSKGPNKGKMKQRIYKRFGASPWGVYLKQDVDPQIRKQVKEELRAQIADRIRTLELRKQGVIK